MRKNRVIEQNRCYHLVSRLAHRAFFLDDEEKDRAVALMPKTFLNTFCNALCETFASFTRSPAVIGLSMFAST